MARYTHPLSDKGIKALKQPEKSTQHFDGGGLYLLHKKTNAKYWRLKYQFNGKEKLLAIGVYPKLFLKAARAERAKAKLLIAEGIDPAEQ